MQKGFSLVELSIVLVILGLLVGGILAGKSLIRAAELRAIGSEYQKHLVAAHAFRDKYFSIPGDMADATKFWGRLVNAAHCMTNSSASVVTTGVCDGNGNRTLELANAASESAEVHQYWRHLAAAGLIEGSYTGLAGSGSQLHMQADNVPASKFPSGYWGMRYIAGEYAGSSTMYQATFGNYLAMGGLSATSAVGTILLKPEETWNIDTKLDDGLPGRGKMVVYDWTNCTDAGTQSDYTSGYDLDYNAVACSLIFIRFIT